MIRPIQAFLAFLTASLAALGLSACGGTQPLPTLASFPTKPSIAATVAVPTSAPAQTSASIPTANQTAPTAPTAPNNSSTTGSSAVRADGTLPTALSRLMQATSFHFVYTTNGKTKIEGDSLGFKGNFHYTVVADPATPMLGVVSGEWLISQPAHGKSVTYQNQSGKWTVAAAGLGEDISYTYVALLSAGDQVIVLLHPDQWTASGTQNVANQDADHYIYKGTGGLIEDAWVSKNSGDIVQLQESHTDKNNAVTSSTLIVFSNIDQPVTLPSPQ